MRVVHPRGKFALLIIDSGEASRRVLEHAAEQSGYFWSIRSMSDGRFALEHLWSCLETKNCDLPDIVLTELQVRGLNGIQLTREVRRYAELQRLFVALLCARASGTDQDAAETAGCDFFLRRRDTAEELNAALRAIAVRCGAKFEVPARMLQ